MRDILLTLTIFGSVPVILVKPHIGVLVFSWISYMNPHRFTWGFAYDFQFALLVGATTILAWMLSREPKRLPWNPVTILLLAFALWISFTTLFALYPSQASQDWERTMKILVFNGFVTLGLMRTRERLNALIWVIVVSIGFLGLKGGIFTLSSGGAFRVMGPAGSFITDNNDFGLALVTTIPLMRYLQLISSSRVIRWGLGGVIALSFIAILGTHSRGAILGLAVMVVALFLKTRGRLLTAIGITLVLIIGISFMPESWHARMELITAFEEDESVQGRLHAWGYGIDVALEHPITGAGFGAFLGNTASSTRIGRSAHSIYFQVLGEHGFIGLALFLSLGMATLLTGTSIIRRANTRPELVWARDLASMLQVSVVTYAVAGAFLSRAYFDLPYHFAAVMILTSAIVKETSSKSPKESEVLEHGRMGATRRSPG